MQREQVEQGVFRAYVVLWVLFAIGGVVGFSDAIKYRPADAYLALASGFIGPWVVMKAWQWVYRGFVSKE